MATNGQLLRKLAQGDVMLESEIAQLERAMDGYDYSANILRQNMELGSPRLDIPLPFELVSRQLLQVDTAIVEFAIPSIYDILYIFGSGRVASATGGNVRAQYNGDTGANYLLTYIKGNGTSVTTANVTGMTDMIIGQFSNSGDPANSASIFEARLMHVISSWHKNVLSRTYYNDNTTHDVYDFGAKWLSTQKVERIEVYGTDGTGVKGSTNILAGSLLSVYGIR